MNIIWLNRDFPNFLMKRDGWKVEIKGKCNPEKAQEALEDVQAGELKKVGLMLHNRHKAIVHLEQFEPPSMRIVIWTVPTNCSQIWIFLVKKNQKNQKKIVLGERFFWV